MYKKLNCDRRVFIIIADFSITIESWSIFCMKIKKNQSKYVKPFFLDSYHVHYFVNVSKIKTKQLIVFIHHKVLLQGDAQYHMTTSDRENILALFQC